MPALTPDERRGGLLVAVLLLIGAGWDAWRAASPPAPRPPGAPAAAVVRIAIPESADARSALPDPANRVSAPPDRVDLNRANVRELDGLPGIGPVLAARIVDHRQRHGRFRSVDELRAVRGVGPRLLERLRPRVVAGP